MIRRLCRLIGPSAFLAATLATAQYATLTGTLQASNGLPAVNETISFTPSQWGYIGGTAVVVNTTTYCATSTDGTVVGITNPLQRTINTPMYSGGTLAAANYFVEYAWYTSTGTVTLVSPESTAQLTATGNLQIALPSGPLPAGVMGWVIAIGTSSGGERFQGIIIGNGIYTQSTPLVLTVPGTPTVLTPTALDIGSPLPVANTTICKQVANDAIWPVGTGYTVSMTDPSGNTLPGYPMQWQLLGPNTTINLSNGLPYYHGIVTFPVPILASPYNHSLQSISGPLSLGSYYMTAGGFGVGVLSPLYGFDAEGSGNYGRVNANGGYLVNQVGGATGQCLASDGAALDTFVNCLTSVGPLYYQTIQANGSDQTQRLKLDFSSRFSASDSASPSRTLVDLAASGVSAGSYTSPNITVDTYGRITSASSTSGGFTTGSNANGTWVQDPIGTITQRGQITITAAGATVGSGTITFPLAFPTSLDSLVITVGQAPVGGGQDNVSAYYTGASTSGAGVTVRCAVNIGGSGCSSIGTSMPISWVAIGK